MTNEEKSSTHHLPDEQYVSDETTVRIPRKRDTMDSNEPPTKVFLPGHMPVTPTTYHEDTASFGRFPAAPAQQAVPPYPPYAGPPNTYGNLPAVPAQPPTHINWDPAMPAPVAPTRPIRPRSGALLWVTITSIVIVVAIVAFVLGALLSNGVVSLRPRGNIGSPTQQSLPTATPVPTLEPTPTLEATPTSVSASVNGLTISPDHFDLFNDCQHDNGFRCTAILTVSPDTTGPVSWSASVSDKSAQFHPHNGKLFPGRQSQIIIYIHQSCPYDSTLDISVEGAHINVPLQC